MGRVKRMPTMRQLQALAKARFVRAWMRGDTVRLLPSIGPVPRTQLPAPAAVQEEPGKAPPETGEPGALPAGSTQP